MATQPLKVGVAGPGVGRWHLQRYQEILGVTIQALCDQNAEALARGAAEFGRRRPSRTSSGSSTGQKSTPRRWPRAWRASSARSSTWRTSPRRSFSRKGKKVFLELSGTRGGLSNVTFDYKDTATCIFREENGAMVKTVPLRYPEALETAQAHFVRCVREDLEPSAGASDGVEIMRILDAIYASALEQREVVMQETDFTHPLVEGVPAVLVE